MLILVFSCGFAFAADDSNKLSSDLDIGPGDMGSTLSSSEVCQDIGPGDMGSTLSSSEVCQDIGTISLALDDDKASDYESYDLELDRPSSNVLGSGEIGTFSQLEEMINNASDGSTITLEKDYVYDEGFGIGGIEIYSKSITIDGKGHSINGLSKSTIFYPRYSNLVLNNIKFYNGLRKNDDYATYGGAIFVENYRKNNSLTVNNCTFVNNSAGSGGGAIYIEMDYDGWKTEIFNTKIINCTFINNSAGGGGAIGFGDLVDDGLASIIGCTFMDNSASYGGAIYGCSAYNSTFINNSARRYGGAIYTSHDVMACTFINNSAIGEWYNGLFFTPGCGGAVYNYNYDYFINVVDSTFKNNNAGNFGGALFECFARNCTFINNSAIGQDCEYDEYNYYYSGGYGGAICDGLAINCTFINNSALSIKDWKNDDLYGYGGAVYINSSDLPENGWEFINCTFNNNFAKKGNGGAIWSNNSLSLIGCTFNANRASVDGGALYIIDGGVQASIKNCEFDGNNASDWGGAIYYSGLDALISDSTFKNNRIYYYDGGAIYIDKNLSSSLKYNFTMIDNAFQSNTPNIYAGLVNFKSKILSVRTSNSEGSVRAKINGKVYSSNISSHTASFNLKNLSKGSYNASIYFYGDDEKGYGITVPIFIESDYKLTSSDLTKYYGGLEKFTVKLTNNSKAVNGAKVKITLNGNQSTVTTDSKGQASIDINLAPGTYSIISEYDGVSSSSKLTVKSTLTVNDAKGTYLNSKVSASFLNASGNALENTKVSFKVGSKTYTTTTNKSGIAIANVDLDVGNYTVTAINPKNNEQKTSKLTISKAKSTMTLSSTSNNGAVTLTASLSPSTASGNVIFNINKKNYTAKINNSKASQTITGLNVGNYTAKASYAGDKNLNSSSASTKVTVKKVTPTKIIYEDMTTGPVPKSAGRIGNYFCVKLVDEKNNPLAGVPIKIGFNGVIYNRTTESDGGARLQINLANEDLYTFAICFLGDDNYQASFEVAKITVDKNGEKPSMKNKTSTATKVNATQQESRLKTYINYSNMDTKSVLKAEGRAGEYFVVKLLDNNKKALADVPIKIGFNGVIYNRTTNATGEARLQINLLKPTLYTFAIGYLGDTKYQAAFEVAKITVKAQTPKLTSSSKTFKASAKTKSLSATLVSERGTPISGQKVSFTVNGKTYTGKTNSKGVATVNISLNKKGTYACTVKFAGMTGANAKSTKTAVKIT